MSAKSPVKYFFFDFDNPFFFGYKRLVSVKTYLYRCLNSTATSEGRLVNGTISFLILFSIAVIPLHFFISEPEYQWLESGLLLFASHMGKSKGNSFYFLMGRSRRFSGFYAFLPQKTWHPRFI